MRIEIDKNGNITEHEDAPVVKILQEDYEAQRILSIKTRARGLIESKYSQDKQRNILMSMIEVDIKSMNDYILSIRNISNEVEINKTELDDIDWNI